MADTVAITPGSGASIAADDVSGVLYQRVKLVDATADSTTATGVAANPLVVSASGETGSLYNGATALTPKFAKIAAASNGNNTVVAEVSGKKIRVLALQLIASDVVNAKWQSGASGTDLTGLAYLVADTGMVLPYNPLGWFETAASALLNLNLSAAEAVGGCLTYVEV
jgi:hypothetical protein